jgi:hypothetical protein
LGELGVADAVTSVGVRYEQVSFGVGKYLWFRQRCGHTAASGGSYKNVPAIRPDGVTFVAEDCEELNLFVENALVGSDQSAIEKTDRDCGIDPLLEQLSGEKNGLLL